MENSGKQPSFSTRIDKFVIVAVKQHEEKQENAKKVPVLKVLNLE